jgi:hypothetical protein
MCSGVVTQDWVAGDNFVMVKLQRLSADGTTWEDIENLADQSATLFTVGAHDQKISVSLKKDDRVSLQWLDNANIGWGNLWVVNPFQGTATAEAVVKDDWVDGNNWVTVNLVDGSNPPNGVLPTDIKCQLFWPDGGEIHGVQIAKGDHILVTMEDATDAYAINTYANSVSLPKPTKGDLIYADAGTPSAWTVLPIAAGGGQGALLASDGNGPEWIPPANPAMACILVTAIGGAISWQDLGSITGIPSVKEPGDIIFAGSDSKWAILPPKGAQSIMYLDANNLPDWFATNGTMTIMTADSGGKLSWSPGATDDQSIFYDNNGTFAWFGGIVATSVLTSTSDKKLAWCASATDDQSLFYNNAGTASWFGGPTEGAILIVTQDKKLSWLTAATVDGQVLGSVVTSSKYIPKWVDSVQYGKPTAAWTTVGGGPLTVNPCDSGGVATGGASITIETSSHWAGLDFSKRDNGQDLTGSPNPLTLPTTTVIPFQRAADGKYYPKGKAPVQVIRDIEYDPSTHYFMMKLCYDFGDFCSDKSDWQQIVHVVNCVTGT